MAPLTEPRLRRRFSLRVRVVLVVLAVAVAPQLFLVAWSQVDRNVPGHLWTSVRNAVVEAAAIDAKTSNAADRDASLDRLARREHVRLRMVGPGGAVWFDRDYEDPADPFDRFEAFFLGDQHPPSLAELDDTMGAPADRAEVRTAATDLPHVGCQYVGLVFCQAVLRAAPASHASSDVALAQRSSLRAVQTVYALRYQLVRIALVTVPLAAILAFYMSRRVVRPLEELRTEALAQSSLATRNVALSYRHADEVGDLANALNELLGTLDTKRRENEAFIADLVHELKNPVAAVRATADSVTADLTEERAARISRVLRDSTGKMDRLVTQFLELARAEAGMPNEARAVVDVGALLQGLTRSAADDERYRGIAFEVVAPDRDVVVRGVDYRLESLFRELIANAASFSKPGAHVNVEVKSAEDRVVVLVRDEGPGIDEADLPRVFDRFFTTRGREHGSGLGLALVKAVAEAHGGSVSVSSAREKGTTFTVSLPRAVTS